MGGIFNLRQEPERLAVLLDGGFVKRKLLALNAGRERPESPPARAPLEDVYPTAQDVVELVDRIRREPRLDGCRLLRAYFYDGPPISGRRPNPLGGKPYLFDGPYRALNQRLHDSLRVTDDFAVRQGDTVFRGWRLREESLRDLSRSPRFLTPEDLAPSVEQKGVDLRIGLDVALLSLKHLVDTIVLVTGDSDLIPAMKLARREGLWVYLDTMGHEVRSELVEHADYVFSSSA